MKIAVLTNFSQFSESFSLTHCVRNQALMLKRYGHETTIFVSQQCPGEDTEFDSPYPVQIVPLIPDFEPFEYATIRELSSVHADYAQNTSRILVQALSDFDLVFTHDFLTVPRNLPLAESLRLVIPQLPQTRFLHFIHSIPTNPGDWWNVRRYSRNSRLVYPNRTDRPKLAEAFNCDIGFIKVIPHIVDPRTYFEFQPETWKIIDQYPGLIESSFAQVYPAAADRLSDKGLEKLIKTFISLKRKSFSVCLLIVDSWTGNNEREDKRKYKKLAYENGLSEKDFGFISDIPEFPNGLPRRILRELTLCSNLFVYPTKGESFGLPSREAALTGVLPVNNRSLSMMFEVGFGDGIYAEFGSCEHKFSHPEKHFFDNLSNLIISRATEDETFQAKTDVRQQLNLDSIYRNRYAPIFSEIMN